MALTPGARLGVYDITAQIGEGGMGQVFRATDTKLKRQVAIKILPPAVAADAERLARFQREAEVLASLNHPNIAAIYGLEDTGGLTALVMELVEGDDLSQRIARGAIPLDEALPIAKQIAEALEAAHEQGIIHRDLKPANIKVREDGTVKVLDFGLAKAMEPTGAISASVSMSPTITTPAMTQAGMILGTAAYMSPEQASGKPVDKRSDIWSFGVVLWEMLTGRRLFDAETISHTLADVLRAPIEFSLLPADTPQTIRGLLRRCLNRDVRKRLRDIGEARLQLEETLSGAAEVTASAVASGTVVATPSRTRERLAWTVAAVFAVAAVGSAGWLRFGHRVPAPAKVAFDITADAVVAPFQIALSPDGTRLIMTAPTSEGNALWMRRLEDVGGAVIPGTVGALFPFWSPDGRFAAFFEASKLYKIDVFGGPPQPLANAGSGRGGTWNRDGLIVFAPTSDGPLFRVSAAGGDATQVTELDKGRGDTAHRHPKFLPDGTHFIFFVASAKPENAGLYLGSLESKTATRLVASDAMGLFAPPDYLLFVRGGTLMAQTFDPGRLQLRGGPFPVVSGVGINPGNSLAGIAVSDTGVLAYRVTVGSRSDRILRWVDRSGNSLGDVDGVGSYENVVLAPGGDRLVESRLDGSTGDLWIVDLQRRSSARFTFDPALDDNAVWSPDGSQIVFSSTREGSARNLYMKSAAGARNEELILRTDTSKYPTDWSRDGQSLLYTDSQLSNDVWVLPLSGDRKPIPFLTTPANENRARFSPDGHWIAYTSDESGNSCVYVQRFPASGGKWQVSEGAGVEPHWRGDGRELYYSAREGIWAVDVTASDPSTFTVGMPHKLFATVAMGAGADITRFDVSRDGQRFLLNLNAAFRNNIPPVRVIVNWTAGLKQ